MQEREASSHGDGLSEHWARAVLERAWWLDADERDRDAAELDAVAQDRDTAAAERDRAAGARDESAHEREQLAVERAVAAVRRLALADRRDADRWVESLEAVEQARARADRSPSEETRAAVRQAETDSEALVVTLMEAAMLRDEVRAELEQLAQFLRAAAADRRAAAAERQGAAADRIAAQDARERGLSDRQQAAIDRARDGE